MDIRHGLAGGLAGIAVDVVFYPLETIKTRIMGSSPEENLTKIAKSKFRGFSCQMIVSFPYSFLFFYIYEAVRCSLQGYYGCNVVASIAAETVANIFRNPFEMVKQQMMVGRSDRIFSSVLQVFRVKGVLGLYTGFQSTLARDIVFSGCQLPLFELLRTANLLELSPTMNASLSGALAALMSAIVSCPLDVLKTRLMTQDLKNQSAVNMLRKIYSQGKFKAFFTGVQFRCSILAFGGIVYFGALQQARTLIGLG